MAYELHTLERALNLLSILATEHPLRLNQLTERLDANQTTVLRMLRVLERHGFVRRTSNGREYQLGTRLAELGLSATSSIEITSAIRPWTSALSRRYTATTHVGLLRTNAVTVIAKIDAPESRVQYSSLGTRMPLHATAAGKAALAVLELPIEALAARTAPMAAFTPNSITDVKRLEDDLAQTTQRRFSIEYEEYNVGFACVGSAFELGDDVYTVSVSGAVVPHDELVERGQQLRDAMGDFLAQYAGAVRGLGQGTADRG
jgi:DNA-binding IclR family transcriptional regulator